MHVFATFVCENTINFGGKFDLQSHLDFINFPANLTDIVISYALVHFIGQVIGLGIKR